MWDAEVPKDVASRNLEGGSIYSAFQGRSGVEEVVCLEPMLIARELLGADFSIGRGGEELHRDRDADHMPLKYIVAHDRSRLEIRLLTSFCKWLEKLGN